MANRQGWIEQAREHWKEHLPAMCARLEEAGTLEKELRAAVEAMADEIDVLMSQGFTFLEAWEATREQYLFRAPEVSEFEDDEELPIAESWRLAAQVNRLASKINNEED